MLSALQPEFVYGCLRANERSGRYSRTLGTRQERELNVRQLGTIVGRTGTARGRPGRWYLTTQSRQRRKTRRRIRRPRRDLEAYRREYADGVRDALSRE